jgi:hypothetical protein
MPVAEANKRLIEAVKAGDIGGIRALLADGADDLDLALIVAIRERHAQAAAYLLDSGANAQAWNNRPIRRALEVGLFNIVRLLIIHGAILNIKEINNLVIKNNAFEYKQNLAMFLLNLEKDTHIKCDNILVKAAMEGQIHLMKLLISCVKDVNADGRRALQQAAALKQLGAVEILLNSGVIYQYGSDEVVDKAIKLIKHQNSQPKASGGGI